MDNPISQQAVERWRSECGEDNDSLMVIDERDRIYRSTLHDRPVPNLTHIIILGFIPRLDEVVMQRRVEHAEL